MTNSGVYLVSNMAETPHAHAPRGPLKGPPIDVSTHGRRCTAKSSRTGQPCKKYAIDGGTVCNTHGGSAPQVKAKALDRLMALQHPAIDRLDKLINQDAFPSVAYAASRDVLDRTMGRAQESVSLQVSGSLDIVGRIREARKRLQAREADPQNP